ncbi:MAG TPA: hypothetical protein VGM88_33485 [Kofleriaceae bacterium]|jgi:hypothetical protein
MARGILTLIACGALAPAAAASPFSDPTAARTAFTGSTEATATSITLNPAAIGLSNIDELYLAVTGTLDNIGITPAGGAHIADVEDSGGAQLAFLWHPGDFVTLGFDLRTPPGEQYVSAQPALAYHVLGGRQRDYIATVALSLKLTGDIFVGASLSHDNTFLRMHYLRDTGTTEAPADAEDDVIVARSPWLSSLNLMLNVGAAVQIQKDVWIGVGYHTPPGSDIQSELSGSATVTQPGGNVLGGRSVVDVSFPASVDGELRWRLPWRTPDEHKLDLRIGARWEDTSRFTAYDIREYGPALAEAGIPEWTLRPRGLHDTTSGWAGVDEVDAGQRWRFGARLGFSTSSVDTARTNALTIAPFSYTIDLGAQLRLSPSWLVQLTYGLQIFPPVHVSRSSFDPQDQIDCAAASYDYNAPSCVSVRDGYAIQAAEGEYTKFEHAARLAFRYQLP